MGRCNAQKARAQFYPTFQIECSPKIRDQMFPYMAEKSVVIPPPTTHAASVQESSPGLSLNFPAPLTVVSPMVIQQHKGNIEAVLLHLSLYQQKYHMHMPMQHSSCDATIPVRCEAAFCGGRDSPGSLFKVGISKLQEFRSCS